MMIFSTGTHSDPVLESLPISRRPLNPFDSNKAVRDYLRSRKVRLSGAQVERLVQESGADMHTIRFFADLVEDLRNLHGKGTFDVEDLYVVLNNAEQRDHFLADHILAKLPASTVHVLELIAAHEFFEPWSFVKQNWNTEKGVVTKPDEALGEASDAHLVYTSRFIDVAIRLNQDFVPKVRNRVYRYFFLARFQEQRWNRYEAVCSSVASAYDRQFAAQPDWIPFERAFRYRFAARDYSTCAAMLDLFSDRHSTSLKRLSSDGRRAVVYASALDLVAQVPLEEVSDGDRRSLRLSRVQMRYELFLWGVEEIQNLSDAFSELEELYQSRGADLVALRLYPVVALMHARLVSDSEVSWDEVNSRSKRFLGGR